ncbi:MAG: hypothetical protein A2V84_01415 [Chloroflexi bacterium RBG_16_70_13]|nr:MAG: hypothetical protein A2V84_01415 [Chloroflexi bacterium RBG_16_70_13]
MITSARTPGSIRSIAVEMPFFARVSAWRAFSAVAGSLMTADALSAPSETVWRACSAAAFACSAACCAACFARSRKLIPHPPRRAPWSPR